MLGRTWLVLLVALVPAAAGADEWNKRYPITDRADVTIETFDGAVEVEAWDRPEVNVHVVTEGWRIRPSDVRIVDATAGDRVRVSVRDRWIQIHFGVVRRSIRIKVMVPRRADLAIRSGDGDVRLGPMAGRVMVSTGDGAIAADGLEGNVMLETGDGAVEANGLQGRLSVATGDGRVRVEGRFDGLALRTGDGPITAVCENGSTMGGGWDIRSGDGDITLRIGTDLRANLDAHTGDGHVTLELPIVVERSARHGSLRGALNGGGPTLRAVSGDGRIRIEKL